MKEKKYQCFCWNSIQSRAIARTACWRSREYVHNWDSVHQGKKPLLSHYTWHTSQPPCHNLPAKGILWWEGQLLCSVAVVFSCNIWQYKNLTKSIGWFMSFLLVARAASCCCFLPFLCIISMLLFSISLMASLKSILCCCCGSTTAVTCYSLVCVKVFHLQIEWVV